MPIVAGYLTLLILVLQVSQVVLNPELASDAANILNQFGGKVVNLATEPTYTVPSLESVIKTANSAGINNTTLSEMFDSGFNLSDISLSCKPGENDSRFSLELYNEIMKAFEDYQKNNNLNMTLG